MSEVAGRMSVRVVELLEVIEVDHDGGAAAGVRPVLPGVLVGDRTTASGIVHRQTCPGGSIVIQGHHIQCALAVQPGEAIPIVKPRTRI